MNNVLHIIFKQMLIYLIYDILVLSILYIETERTNLYKNTKFC